MPAPKKNEAFHYGWIIVAVGALTLFSCLGLARFAFGMLLPSMGAGLGLAYDQMGFVGTGNFAGYLLSVALAPLLIRRWRPRLTIVVGLLLIAAGMFSIALCHSFAALLVLYFCVGVGSGLANIPAMVLVSHWFRRRSRGRAAGLMIVGNGAAIVFSGFFVPSMNSLYGGEGWRATWLVLGLITLLIAVLAAALLRNDPEEKNLEPYGETEALPQTSVVDKAQSGTGRVLVFLGLLYFAFGATYMVYGSFVVTTMVREFGFAEARAGMFWSWVGFLGVFSGVGFGIVSDRIGRRGGLTVVFALQTLAYLLVGLQLGTGALILSVVLYGLTVFAIPTIMAAAVGDYLGLPRAAGAFSLITFFFAAGQTFGPGAAGLLAESTGTFFASYIAAAVLTAVSTILSRFLPKPARTS